MSKSIQNKKTITSKIQIVKSFDKQMHKTTSSFIGRVLVFAISILMIVMMFFSGLNSCSPVRTNLSKKEAIIKDNKPKDNKSKNKRTNNESSNDEVHSELLSDDESEIFDFSHNEQQKSSNKEIAKQTSKSNIKVNSKDTLEIDYPPISSSMNNLFDLSDEFDFTPEFEKAVLEFDINFIEKACNKFDFFASTLNPTDTLYFESLFYKSECLIARLEYAQAERLLNRIIKNKNTPEPVLQKSIVRIGHIYCAMGSKELAEQTFEEFKNNFPNSKLLKLANCEAIKISKK